MRKKKTDTSKTLTRFDGPLAPFIIKNCELCEFRPREAIIFLRDESNRSDERLIVLTGLTAWMTAPDGIINTNKPNAGRVTAQSFIYQAMVLRAVELLDEAFYDPRLMFTSKDPTEIALSRLESVFHDFCGELFIALGGFEAVLKCCSMSQFKASLRSQRRPVDNVVSIANLLVEKDASGTGATWRLEMAAKNVSRQLVARHTESDKPRGLKVGAIKSHWRSLKPAAPLLYAAARIDQGLFLDMFFRDDELEIEREYERGLDWVQPWLDDADSCATILMAKKMLPAWPPETAYFVGGKPKLG